MKNSLELVLNKADAIINIKWGFTMRQKGFTLLELSAVLIIIGLIVGGISVGNDIIRQAKLRNVMTEMTSLVASFNNFTSIYVYKPGDFPKADRIWPTTCITDPLFANNKCDGNGDGKVSRSMNGTSYENLRAMEHMYLAGLIDNLNQKNGYVVSSTIQEQAGVNFPAAQSYNGAGYQINTQDEQGILFQTKGDMLTFTSNLPSGFLNGPVISPKDAFYIDTKMDDGNPALGNIYAGNPSGTVGLCTSPPIGTNTSNANYILSDTTNSCGIMYWINKFIAS